MNAHRYLLLALGLALAAPAEAQHRPCPEGPSAAQADGPLARLLRARSAAPCAPAAHLAAPAEGLADVSAEAHPYAEAPGRTPFGPDEPALTPSGEIVQAVAPHAASGMASDGRLVEGFGDRGWASFRVSPVRDPLHALVPLAGGTMLGVGEAFRGNRTDLGLTRFLPDGRLDPSYGQRGQASFGFAFTVQNRSRGAHVEPFGVVPEPAGTHLVVAHSRVYIEEEERSLDSLYLFRLSAEGIRDFTFGRNGRVAVGLPSLSNNEWYDAWRAGVTRMPDGRLVVRFEGALLRLDASYRLDASFGSGGVVLSSSATLSEMNAHLVLPDGGLLVGGWAGSLRRPTVARLRPDGTLDTSFGSGGRRLVAPSGFTGAGGITGLIETPGGTLALVIGEVQGEFDQSYTSAVVRLDAAGGIDPAYGSGGAGRFPLEHYLGRMSLARDGGLLLFGIVGDDEEPILARLTAAGQPLAGFGTNGVARMPLGAYGPYSRYAHGAEERPDGRIVVFGQGTANAFDAYYYHRSAWLAGFTPAGAPDAAFGQGGNVYTDFGGAVTNARAIAPLPDGGAFLAGTSGGLGFSTSFVARVRADGSLDPAFGVAGRFLYDDSNTTGYFGEAHPRAMAVRPDGSLVLTGIEYTPGSSAGFFTFNCFQASVSADGRESRVTSYPWATMTRCNSLAVQPDGMVLLGGDRWVSSQYDMAVLRTRPDGQPDAAFGTNGVATVGVEGADLGHTVALLPDGKVLLAGTAGYVSTSTAREGDFAVARLNANGSRDATFGTNGVARVDAGGLDFLRGMHVDREGRILLTGETRAGLTPGPQSVAVARLTPGGARDATFGTGGLVVVDRSGETPALSLWPEAGVRVQRDGKPVVAGYMLGGGVRPFALRLTEAGAPDASFGDGGMVAPLHHGGASSNYGFAFDSAANGDLLLAGYMTLGRTTLYPGLIRIANSVSTPAEDTPEGAVLALGAAPNPSRGALTVRLHLPEADEARVAVYDLLGREVGIVHEGPLPAGPHALAFAGAARLAPGVYVLRLIAGAEARTERVTIVR